MGNRKVIYTSGTEAQHQEQLGQCQEMCTEHGYVIVGIARGAPGNTDAWENAHRMVRAGEADGIIFASGADLPDMLESATGGIHNVEARRPSQRRTRPVRRDAGA